MITILRDFPVEGYKDVVADGLADKEIMRIGSVRTPRKVGGWLRGCLETIRKTSSRDIIVAMFDFQAVMCWWICRLTLKKRNIVCVNLMLKDKTTLKNKLVAFLYKKALSSKNFIASVDSLEYGKWIKRRFTLKRELYLVHDVCRKEYMFKTDRLDSNTPYIFAGGGAARDWNFAFNLAENMPDIDFRFVMSGRDYEQYKSRRTDNVKLYHDIPYSDFLKQLTGASLVCLPINVQTPAGLIVLFQAGANRVPVMITSTLATREYVTEDRGECLPNEIELWRERIRYILGHRSESDIKTGNFYEYLYRECSEECYISQIRKMIEVYE